MNFSVAIAEHTGEEQAMISATDASQHALVRREELSDSESVPEPQVLPILGGADRGRARIAVVSVALLLGCGAIALAISSPLSGGRSWSDAGAIQALDSEAGFTIKDLTFTSEGNTADFKQLVNKQTGEYVDFVVNSGGKVMRIVLRSPRTGKLRNVTLTHERNVSDIMMGGTGRYAKGSILAPWANRIENGTYRFGKKEYALNINMKKENTSIHGYLFDKPLKSVSAHAGPSAAEVTLHHDFGGTDPGYPFPMSINLTYRLDAKGFSLTTVAYNRHVRGAAIPFFMGWHPYLAVSDVSKAFVIFDNCTGWNLIKVKKQNLIPTGNTVPFKGFNGTKPIGGTKAVPTLWDNGFKATAAYKCPNISTRVLDPAGDTSVVWSDRRYPWVQVFTGIVKGLGEQGIAVEPMSGETDAYNNHQGNHLLQAGESWKGTFGAYLELSCGLGLGLQWSTYMFIGLWWWW